ncbi:MAG: carboxylating nicotinate-nucleotide diphosphorylase [Candidatus Aminicenantes bacterium]|nr:carboxylating nicotinate-nucleotide diphosphorylase [Candidatus Aminicenantes bacterium]
MWRKDIDSIIEAALREDMPQGDITSESIIPMDSISRVIILAKEEGILAGIYVAERVYKIIDTSVFFEKHFEDGKRIKKGDKIAALEGPSISILKGERTALNFIQMLSGIATATQKYVKAMQGTRTKVLDTRKTTPGLRILEKYAVKMGGGKNHRLNLSEMVLIKDNHLKIVGSISEAVKSARRRVKRGIKIEVETSNLDEVKEAFQGGADMIMLDNMSLRKMKEAVQWVKGRVILEVSGNINLHRAKQIAALGVDFISVGSLTHSNKSLDISMEFLD